RRRVVVGRSAPVPRLHAEARRAVTDGAGAAGRPALVRHGAVGGGGRDGEAGADGDVRRRAVRRGALARGGGQDGEAERGDEEADPHRGETYHPGADAPLSRAGTARTPRRTGPSC